MGVVNWGIYFGNGLSYVVGTYVPPLNILGQVSLWSVESEQLIGCFTVRFFHRQGWRWAYYLAGIPGYFLAFLLLVTTSDPGRTPRDQSGHPDSQSVSQSSDSALNCGSESSKVQSDQSIHRSIWNSVRYFCKPDVFMVCFGACVRHVGNISTR